MQQELEIWIWKLCVQSGKDEDFYNTFSHRLCRYPDIMAELDYYRRTEDFLAEAAVEGFTVLDIMVWQIDHFKSHMDRGEHDMKENPACMVLMAFDTMLKMQESPQAYLNAMRTETGTDYAGKF